MTGRDLLPPGPSRQRNPRSQWREFQCPVVNETVLIRLKRGLGFSGSSSYSVQCNQVDCQYVERNEPPCPLHVGMFAHAIRAIGDRRREATRTAPGPVEED